MWPRCHDVFWSRLGSTARMTFFAHIWLGFASVTIAQPQEHLNPVREALEKTAVALHVGDAESALRLLSQVAESEPENPWLWYYRGAAYLLHNQPYRAMDALERSATILHDLGDPDPALAGLIETQQRNARKKVLQVSLTTGFAYDSNVSFLAGDAATLGQIAGEEDGKFSAGTRIDFAAHADGTNSLVVGAHTSHSWHFQIDPFDDSEYGGYVRYERKWSQQWRSEIQYDYEYTLLDYRGYLSANGSTLAMHYTWTPWMTRVAPLESSVYYRLDVRDFAYPVFEAFNQDGLTHGVGIQQTWLVVPVPNWSWRVSTGYRFDYVSTEGTEYDRKANNIYVGVQMPLVRPGEPDKYLLLPDKELTLRFDADWQSARYRNISLEDRDRDRRRDRTTFLSLSLSQLIRDDPRDGRLNLHVVSEWTNAESNVELRGRVSPFTYEKFVCGILLQWSW